jgi:hypothetical protein
MHSVLNSVTYFRDHCAALPGYWTGAYGILKNSRAAICQNMAIYPNMGRIERMEYLWR